MARPVQSDPGADGAHRAPRTQGALLHLEPASGRGWPAGPRPRLLGVENGLHRTLDVPCREDDCRLRRAALNMVQTIQQNFSLDVSIGRPDRMPALDSRPNPGLIATLSFPWVGGGPLSSEDEAPRDYIHRAVV